MNYTIEISGGLLGIKNVFEGKLNGKHESLRKALLSEKNLMKLDPMQINQLKYIINIDAGRRKKFEFVFNEDNLPNNLKELLEVAKTESEVY